MIFSIFPFLGGCGSLSFLYQQSLLLPYRPKCSTSSCSIMSLTGWIEPCLTKPTSSILVKRWGMRLAASSRGGIIHYLLVSHREEIQCRNRRHLKFKLVRVRVSAGQGEQDFWCRIFQVVPNLVTAKLWLQSRSCDFLILPRCQIEHF